MTNHLFSKLLPHFGHKIECAIYGPKSNPENVAIECMDCCVVLVDANPEFEDEESE